MPKKKFEKAFGVLANLGVIAGLVFLAIEIQQNSDLMRIQINQARADAAMVANAQTFDSPYIPAILVKVTHDQGLSEEETIRYQNYFRSQNRNQDNVLSQYEADMLGEYTPRSIIGFVCSAVAVSETSFQIWEQTKSGYSDRYIQFVEEHMAECSQ